MSWQNQLRVDARAIFDAGVAAVEPRALVAERLRASAPNSDGGLWVAAIGKAAVAMAQGAEEVCGDLFRGGVLIAPPGASEGGPSGLRTFEGGHPIPNQAGMRGATALRELAAGLEATETLLCLISGGGSALMTLPPAGVPLADVQATTQALLRAGATIDELNCVRKHLDLLKGGRLAAAAAPARIQAMVLSDVVGDPLDVIASGPVSPDPTTFDDAWGVLSRRGVVEGVPASVRAYLEAGRAGAAPESPKAGDRCFDRVDTEIVGNNTMAARAAVETAASLGYEPRLLTTEAAGEASELGRELARQGVALSLEADRPCCLVAAGETTVTVEGGGRGGRNQELALGAALTLAGSRQVLVASMGTDGVDGPTDAAGALADGESVSRAEPLGVDLAASLADNDAYTAFLALDDLIRTGPTGTNVMDLMLVLVVPS